MTKLAAIGLGAALALATLTTAPQPAKADTTLLVLGGIAVGALIVGHHIPSLQTVPPWSWLHRHWCETHYKTYNPLTNLYFHKVGEQRQCRSPHG